MRAGKWCDLWGRFATPSEFFSATRTTPRPARRYRLDDYGYDLEMPPDNYHRYESGGFCSLIEHWQQQNRELQMQEEGNDLREHDLVRLLEGQSHDGYVVSYFKRGAFLDIYLTDYVGPRYKVTGDNPRGVDHYLRDGLQVPREMSAKLPVVLEEAEIEGGTLSATNNLFVIDPKGGYVSAINGSPVRLGQLRSGLESAVCHECSVGEGRMVLEGSLAGFGEISFTYGVSNDTLFCMVGGSPSGCSPRCETPYWQDCVYLSHSLPGEAELLRHGSGHFEETALAEFFSPAQVLVRGASLSLRLGHGGNLFFKRAGNELWNLLWAYNEISDSFWWSVSVGPG